MPIDDMMNPNDQGNSRPPLAEFEGYAECPLFSEQVRISLSQNEVTISALFDQLILPYSEILSFSFENSRASSRIKRREVPRDF